MADVRVEQIAKWYGSLPAVDDVTATFREGTVTVLLGPSGCGKTTLMRMIVGLERPSSGRVFIGDNDVTRTATSKRRVGMVFQYPVIYRGTTVERNIELPLVAERVAPQERRRRIERVAEIVGIADLLKVDVDRIDNAGRQKVAVARAVARQPEVLLFDEPITNVDLTSKLELKRSLKSLFAELKQTIIYVTHDQTEAMSLADSIALMNRGRIVQFAPPREIYDNPADVFAGWFLGNPGMNFLADCFTVADERVTSPLLAIPLTVVGDAAGARIIGVRPEAIRVFRAQRDDAVAATVISRAITIGGRALMELDVDGAVLKAVVEDRDAAAAGERVWMALRPEEVRLFTAEGRVVASGVPAA